MWGVLARHMNLYVTSHHETARSDPEEILKISLKGKIGQVLSSDGTQPACDGMPAARFRFDRRETLKQAGEEQRTRKGLVTIFLSSPLDYRRGPASSAVLAMTFSGGPSSIGKKRRHRQRFAMQELYVPHGK